MRESIPRLSKIYHRPWNKIRMSSKQRAMGGEVLPGGKEERLCQDVLNAATGSMPYQHSLAEQHITYVCSV